jgi:hypothetical protein
VSNRKLVLTRATRRNIPEDTILHSHRLENFKSYIVFLYGEATHRHMRRLETLRIKRTKKKKGFIQEPHGVTSQKTPFFIVTTVKTSNLPKHKPEALPLEKYFLLNLKSKN